MPLHVLFKVCYVIKPLIDTFPDIRSRTSFDSFLVFVMPLVRGLLGKGAFILTPTPPPNFSNYGPFCIVS